MGNDFNLLGAILIYYLLIELKNVQINGRVFPSKFDWTGLAVRRKKAIEIFTEHCFSYYICLRYRTQPRMLSQQI